MPTSFCRKKAALLNVLASVCDVFPADSSVHWRKQPGGCSYTMTVHRFFECFAWMLSGFRSVARTLLLTVTFHSDCIRLLLTKEHPAIHITDIISELMYQLNEIKLMTVHLYSYGTDLWSNKDDIWHGQNQRFLLRTAEWECFTADTCREL